MNEVKPDTKAALAFLTRFYPEGPWLLTAIEPDRKSIETRTFLQDQLDAMQDWVDGWNGRRNMYFSVNPPKRVLQKKAEREDIAAMHWLHVDVDPRAGEDLHAEQERALGLLTSKLPSGVPAPTCVIFSGGGYQGFWKLAEPFPIDGQPERYEEAKRYNKQLELLFGADNCHNVDRIMRLPGTVNIPDAKKQKKGRVPALAHVVSFTDIIYPLAAFTPAQQVQMPGVELGGTGPMQVKVSGNVQRVANVDELDEWGVPDRVKVILVQGHHPDEPKEGDNSRSAWLFDAVCQLVRCRVPDEVIFSILTDADYRISESVLDKGSNSERYALRQIQRAKEEAEEPWLRKLNEKHAVIRNWGGKCRVVEEVADAAFGGRPRLTKQSFDDFRNAYMHITVEAGKKADGSPLLMALGKYWLGHSGRRQYDHIVFAPGKDLDGVYNLWRGFACEARPGDCQLFLDHLRDNICSGNEEHYAYLVGWMARAVQHPDSPGQIAIVMRGGQGSGKSFFAKTFGSLFGRHFLQVSDPKHLIGSFNAHLRDCVVLFGDEAFYAGDKKHESVLKMLITEETLAIEAKGVDVEASPNYSHIILASNSQWVVPAGAGERRFLVLDVSDRHIQDDKYFQRIADQLTSGGREALLHYLLNHDLSAFNVRQVPKTNALQEQKLLSLGPDESWWFGKLQKGYVLEDEDKWSEEVMSGDLVLDYTTYCRNFNVTRRGNEIMLNYFLRKVCPAGFPRTRRRMARVTRPTADGFGQVVNTRARFYLFPPLAACREHWEKVYGRVAWDNTEEIQEGKRPAADSSPF